jgi:hypothetical protein
MNRRELLGTWGCGFGMLALKAMLADEASAKIDPLAPKVPHHQPRAKRVIFLWMQGGPSQVDLFDYKPQLARRDGAALPYDMPSNRAMPGVAYTKLMGPIAKFAPAGESGMQVADLLPNLSRHADDLCLLKAMEADSEAHAPAVRQLHSGATQLVRPSIGSWVAYGLGTENGNLPAFITIAPQISGDGGSVQLYSNAFLPAVYQGTPLGNAAAGARRATIGYLKDPSIEPETQRRQLDLIQEMNRAHLRRHRADRRLEGAIESFELAFRMQAEVPELLDIDSESQATLDLYGVGAKPTDDFGRQCLLARRFAEAGVRFIQITSRSWDSHANIRTAHPQRCREVDKPISALIQDLKQRGLFDDTLLVWSGEFGRTPHYQDLEDGAGSRDSWGRGHNPYGFCAWLAGGGVRGGMTFGELDDFGFRAVQDKVHIHDLHATILHLLGLDHERLTYRYSGRDFRLTDVYGRVVHEILA